MKSVWNGAICFGLLTIPVKVYSAVKTQEMNFHYLHDKDLGRITTERVCKKCGQSLEYSELVRGYEPEKGQYVPLTEADLESLNAESTKTITMTDFVDPQEIDAKFFAKTYYLTPDDYAEEVYALLREALQRTHKVGVAKLTWYDREHLAAVRADEQSLFLHILHFAEDVVRPEGLAVPGPEIQVGEEERELAERLIAAMTTHFTPERYHHTYARNLRELVEKKRAGEEVKVPHAPGTPTPAADLRSKLQESIEKAEQEHKGTLAA